METFFELDDPSSEEIQSLNKTCYRNVYAIGEYFGRSAGEGKV